ncbi:MAG: hypothetical protein K1X53_17285 [Candidatus Sumerlaeaceae bacterium]|nr:hypothetical protein [Candidatus Sumerlaeaceae bacterium]
MDSVQNYGALAPREEPLPRPDDEVPVHRFASERYRSRPIRQESAEVARAFGDTDPSAKWANDFVSRELSRRGIEPDIEAAASRNATAARLFAASDAAEPAMADEPRRRRGASAIRFAQQGSGLAGDYVEPDKFPDAAELVELSPARPKRRARKSQPDDLNEEGSDAMGPEPYRPPFDWAAHSRLIGNVAIFGFIFLFVASASGLSYYKFFQKAGAGQIASTAKDSGAGIQSSSKVTSSRTDDEMLKLAQQYVTRGRFDDAISMLSKASAQEQAGEIKEKTQALLVKAYDAKGTQYLKDSKLADAAAAYEKAANLQPESADIALRLGNAYYYCGMMLDQSKSEQYFEKSLASLNKTLELDRNNLQAYERMATVYEGLRQNAQARAAWNKVIQIAPTSAAAQTAGERIKTLSMAN